MPKDNNKNYYLEVNALFVLMVAYAYYKTNKEEDYNDPYHYPIETTVNWTPMMLSSLALLLSSFTSAVLALNPERSNFNLSVTQKVLDSAFKMAEGLLPLANKYGFKLAKAINKEAAEVAEDVAEVALTKIEQAFRFLVILEQIHAHQTARSFEIKANQETGEEGGRYLSKTAYITHNIDKAFILFTESAVAFIWNSALYKTLTRYFNLDDKDAVTSLNTLYLLADLLKYFATKAINNVSLATEIVIYGEDKSQYYKIEEFEFINDIKIFIKNIIDKAQKELTELKDELVKIGTELKSKLLEITDLTKIKDAIADELNMLKISFAQLQEQINKKAEEIAKYIAKITNLEEVYKISEKAKEAISQELELFKHYCGDIFEKMHKSATKVQALCRGKLARVEVKKLLAATTTDGKESGEEEAAVDTIVADQKLSIQPVIHEEKDIAPDRDTKEVHEEAEHHSFFGDLFHLGHYKDADKPSLEKHHHGSILGAIGNALHFPSHHNAESKVTKKDTKSKADKGGSGNQQDSSSSSTGGEKQPSKNHADLGGKALNLDGAYINLVSQKMAEVLFVLNLIFATSKAKVAEAKNKEKEEYEQAKQEAEKNTSNNTVIIKYESLSILEKPINNTQATYYKSGQEVMDMMLVLEGEGISMFGEEGGAQHYYGGIAV